MFDELKKIIKRINGSENPSAASKQAPIRSIASVAAQPSEQFPKFVTVSRQIVAVTNQKGGCAKTTTAINLAACLAEKGYKVLLVDLDPQAHASLGLGIDKDNIDRTVYDVLINNVELNEIILRTQVERLDIAPSNSLLSGAQLELASILGRESVLRIAIRKLLLRKDYDFIFFDCNPSLNLVTINALVAAEAILIPLQTHYYSLEGMKELFSTIEIVRERLNPDLHILGILATLYDTRTKISAKMLEQIRDYFKDKVFNTVIRNNVKLCEAPIYKKPIHIYDRNCAGTQDYFSLTEEIVAKTQRCEVRIESGKIA
ncbi:MAG: AAA family ATPase [Candidatus Omnitrophota bacterium]|nr:AAA family ATPase [Candidatus Omnitrophota bacterium]